MDDLEDRVRKLEHLVMAMVGAMEDQKWQIERLKFYVNAPSGMLRGKTCEGKLYSSDSERQVRGSPP
jgi:hypothetical protein